ncbi:hypothetical protein Mapa_014330 [Marchantia paleacea]|nr:hypothetical protein Mapa_014330 [Marchantia paleacea]
MKTIIRGFPAKGFTTRTTKTHESTRRFLKILAHQVCLFCRTERSILLNRSSSGVQRLIPGHLS